VTGGRHARSYESGLRAIDVGFRRLTLHCAIVGHPVSCVHRNDPLRRVVDCEFLVRAESRPTTAASLTAAAVEDIRTQFAKRDYKLATEPLGRHLLHRRKAGVALRGGVEVLFKVIGFPAKRIDMLT
jgi:hypothetical protein